MMENKSQGVPYIRVGTVYYKRVTPPQIFGDSTTRIVKWSRETITHDHGSSYLQEIRKFDGFCCIPDHLRFQQEVNGFYNIYHRLPYQPHTAHVSTNKVSRSLAIVKHIFGDQHEFGLDYLKILLEQPTQILPILCLVSKQRSTGKSTFLKWLKCLFGLNMSYIKGDAFHSQFNADWANALIVAIDEVLFDRREMTERLKNLSTADKEKLENKGKDREEIEFFAKFILCSNNIDDFVLIDEDETRFWVRKINPILIENTEFLAELISEAPYFLKYLIERPFATKKQSRMWFTPQQLKTDALRRVVCKSNAKLEEKLIKVLFEFFDASEEMSLNAVPADILSLSNKIFKSGGEDINDYRKLLKENWKLTPRANADSYIRFYIDYTGGFCQSSSKGRYFTITKEFILDKYKDLFN